MIFDQLGFFARLLWSAIITISTVISAFSQVGTQFSGVASYYGVPFHGRATASGEIFSQDSMTAAHKQLAFGTLLRVTNTSNGKSCVVKINDRGPFIAGRMIDLSKAAADTLDFIHQGLVTVVCEIIGTAPINRPLLASKSNKSVPVAKVESSTDKKPSKSNKTSTIETVRYEATSPDSTTFFSVQLGSFGVQTNAENLWRKVDGKYPEARVWQVELDGKTWFRVLCGKCSTQEEASILKNKLSKLYPICFLVKFGHSEKKIEKLEE
jgi:rare lipoprotein A